MKDRLMTGRKMSLFPDFEFLKRLKPYKFFFILLLGSVVVGASGCRKGPVASHQKNKKKVKRGRPLPCPVKDC